MLWDLINWQKLKRALLYAIYMALVLLVQDALFSHISILGVRVMLVPAAAVAVARRAGTVASFDVLNKYFTISQMPVVSSTYWNDSFGAAPGQSAQDAEGLQTMRNLARNMAWLLKCIELGRRGGVEPPESESGAVTNFIR